MASNDLYTANYLSTDIQNVIENDEAVGISTDPLSLKIKDEDLVKIIDKRINDSRKFYEENYDLYDRRKKNETYLFGRQIAELENEGEIKDYEAKNLDNVLYEIEASIKPLAMTQLPDLIVTPGQNTDQAKDVAKLITTIVNSDVKKRENRRTLGLAFKHRSVYFVGVIKCRWNPELAGGKGDYEFFPVHPDTVDFDETANEANADKMNWISHLSKMIVQQVFMQFPKAKDKLITQLLKDGIMLEGQVEPSWRALATPIDIREVWFTDYQEAENEEGEKGEWERVEGVCWKYKECILEKMKNPYYDYEGEEQLFTYDNPQLASTKRSLSQMELFSSLFNGQYPPYVQKEQVYHNYFEMPKKPFFFMVYDQWGKQPLDETTSLEQNIRNQDTLDKRGKQIEETLNHRGHHIWSKLSGLKPSDVQKMDHNDPDEDYLVDGMPQQVHEFIPAERPTQQEFADLDRTRDAMYRISGSQAVRGDIQQDTTATNNQIAREGNYTRADDLVEDTINPATEWMARWALQMIKTRYTQEHFRKVLGNKGEVAFYTLQRNMVDEGMEVMIKASGTDKLKKQNNAQIDARMQLIDPLSYYEDMNYDDPKGRAARMITFKTDMPLYISEFVETGATATPELIQKLSTLTQMRGPQPGAVGGQQPQQAGNPQNPSPQNTGQVAAAPPAGAPAPSPRIG